MDLVTAGLEKKIREEGPLAQRMRPQDLRQFFGQESILAPGKPLPVMIENDTLSSLLFYGPPGTGKTSLALIIASKTRAVFNQLNAVTSGVKEVRAVIEEARENWSLRNRRTILFIDEIHRFNKAQQDVLLSAMEEGTVIFIGATTENPFFYLNPPLLSRTALFSFEKLKKETVLKILKLALEDKGAGLGRLNVKATKDALILLADRAEGDVRAALNALERAALIAPEKESFLKIDEETAGRALEERLLTYDRAGDDHYDLASAMIKAIRGSDPDAALYWMARMIRGGEDPLFIARRLIISAAEDVGNANPHALPLAVAAASAVQMIGLPEGRIALAQALTYLAASPKSNASYLAIDRALKLVEEENAPVPRHLKSTAYRGAARLKHGAGYLYPHDYPGHYVEQDYLPSSLKGIKFYEPTEEGSELKLKTNLEKLRKRNKK